MLAEIRDYLETHREVTLGDLANRFDMPESAVRGALRPWIRKGRVVPVSGRCGSGCGSGGCSSCATGPETEIYRWADDLPFRIVSLDRHH